MSLSCPRDHSFIESDYEGKWKEKLILRSDISVKKKGKMKILNIASVSKHKQLNGITFPVIIGTVGNWKCC